MTLDEVLAECPEWYHAIELAPGVITPGRCAADELARQWRALRLPDLTGKTVLDIGAYDGFFSFAAEAASAARVVALDHYVWAADMASYMAEWRETKASGRAIPTPHESRHWRPETLPGKRPFDLAHRARRSRVESVVGDVMNMDLTPLGQFDVVLFLGVLYHLTDPVGALRRVASLTSPDGVAVIETESMEVLGQETRALCEFFPGEELNHDASNWWAPNAVALEGLCRAAGFQAVTPSPELPRDTWRRRLGVARRYWLGRSTEVHRRQRLIVQARR